MSYEFKKLPDVDITEELSKNAHVIVEDDGVTKRFLASELLPESKPHYDIEIVIKDNAVTLLDESVLEEIAKHGDPSSFTAAFFQRVQYGFGSVYPCTEIHTYFGVTTIRAPYTPDRSIVLSKDDSRDWNIRIEPIIYQWESINADPFSEVVIELVEILAERNVTRDNDSEDGYYRFSETPMESNALSADDHYRVCINGDENFYAAKQESYYDDEMGGDVERCFIGNGYLLNAQFEDTGDDFCVNLTDDDFTVIWSSDYGEAITIQISKAIYGEYIDANYLPDTIARVSDIPEVPEHTWESIPDKPFGEETGDELVALHIEIDGKGNGYGNVYDIPETVHLDAGSLYEINWNGTYFSCEACENEKYPGYIFLGNGTLIKVVKFNQGEDFTNTEEPFCIIVDSSGVINIWSEAFIAMPEISISSKKVRPIDSKFIPKAAAVPDVTAAPTAEDFNALLTALRNAGYLAT